jgi:hypothetical protein
VTSDREAEGRIDDLFGVPPDEFVAARDALARELKEAGRADAARSVKSLRRPTVGIWALNRVARDHPKEIDSLLEAGAGLRRAQERLLKGGSTTDLRGASSKRRAQVAKVTELALAALRQAGRGIDPHREAVAATLEAATVDQEVGDLLRRGRLEREATPAVGLGEAAGFGFPEEATEDRPKRPRPRGEPRGPRPKDVGAADERMVAAERGAADAEEAARAAEEEAATARAQADQASARGEELGRVADRLEEEARQARQEAREAATGAREAGNRASKAEAAAARAVRRAAEARGAAEQLAARPTRRS